jgi:uncharacterized protein
MFGDAPETREEAPRPDDLPGSSEGDPGGVVLSGRVLQLLDQADERFRQAEEALRQGDLATYQQRIREAQQLIEQARRAAREDEANSTSPTTTEPSASA